MARWFCRYCLRKRPKPNSVPCTKCCGYKRPPVVVPVLRGGRR